MDKYPCFNPSLRFKLTIMSKTSFLLLSSLLLLTMSCQEKPNTNTSSIHYPISDTTEVVDVYHGQEVADPYRWLEDDLSPKTGDWVKAQNKITHGFLDKIPYRDRIKKRLEELMDYTKISAPIKNGAYTYHYQNNGLENHSVLYRKKEESDSAEVFLDPNTFSKNGTIALSGTFFTRDGALLAYMISEGGSDWRKVIVIDTENKAIVEDSLKNIKFSGLSWYKNEGFYYSSYEVPKEGSVLSGKTQHHRLMYHRLGTPQSEDRLVFGGPEQPFRYIGGRVSEDNRYLVITASHNTSGDQLFYRDLTRPESSIQALVDNTEHDFSFVDNDGDQLLVYTNYNAPRYKLIAIATETPSVENWKDIIPEAENVLSVSTAGGKLFAEYMVDAHSKIKQFDYRGRFEKNIELPGIGTIYGFRGKREAREVFYTFTSFTYPPTIFKYTLNDGQSTRYARPEVDFDPEKYTTEQVFYKSKDGTRVPMFIVYKKGLEITGKNPTYLYAYGGFNVSLQPSFSTERILWLENGGIYAQPNLRGGGEYGSKWHEAGTQLKKQNVFDDFIAAAEYLIDHNYTSSEYLAIRGGSNGGLLVGATMTQRPDLMKVALPAVGVLDMLRYHKFTSGAGWAHDYGTAEDSKEMFDYLLGYSPLHNLKPNTAYPATLITTGDHDDRVVPAHSFKFAAQLQAYHQGENPVLIRIETDAGHGAGVSLAKQLEASADMYSFIWYAMGVTPEIAQ